MCWAAHRGCCEPKGPSNEPWVPRAQSARGQVQYDWSDAIGEGDDEIHTVTKQILCCPGPSELVGMISVVKRELGG